MSSIEMSGDGFFLPAALWREIHKKYDTVEAINHLTNIITDRKKNDHFSLPAGAILAPSRYFSNSACFTGFLCT